MSGNEKDEKNEKAKAKNESFSEVTTWAGASVVFLDKLGVPTFMLFALVAGYYFLQNDFNQKIEERDTKIQQLSTSLSKLNELQLSIANSAMEINSQFVTSTQVSFDELEKMRVLLSANRRTLDENELYITEAKSQLRDLDTIKALNAELSARSDTLRQDFQKIKNELDIEKNKAANTNARVQQLVAAIINNASSNEITELAKSFIIGDKKRAKQAISSFAQNPSNLDKIQDIFGLEYSDLKTIIMEDDKFIEWVKIGEYVYGVSNYSNNAFTNVLKMTLKNNKVDDILVLKEINVIAGLVKTENTFDETIYVAVKDQYFLEIDELNWIEGNKDRNSKWTIAELFNRYNYEQVELLGNSNAEKAEIGTVDYETYNQKNKTLIQSEDAFVEEYLWRLKANNNMERFSATPIALQLLSQPDNLKLFFANAAAGKATEGFKLEQADVGRIGWAVIAENSEVLAIDYGAQQDKKHLIYISILYPDSLYSNKLLKLVYDTKNETLNII